MRPIVIVQIDLLNNLHGSTIICPVTSQVNRELKILRVRIGKRYFEEESDVPVEPLRAIDNRRLVQRLGKLNATHVASLRENLRIVLDVENYEDYFLFHDRSNICNRITIFYFIRSNFYHS
jgi:mRNA interferase MazF